MYWILGNLPSEELKKIKAWILHGTCKGALSIISENPERSVQCLSARSSSWLRLQEVIHTKRTPFPPLSILLPSLLVFPFSLSSLINECEMYLFSFIYVHNTWNKGWEGSSLSPEIKLYYTITHTTGDDSIR